MHMNCHSVEVSASLCVCSGAVGGVRSDSVLWRIRAEPRQLQSDVHTGQMEHPEPQVSPSDPGSTCVCVCVSKCVTAGCLCTGCAACEVYSRTPSESTCCRAPSLCPWCQRCRSPARACGFTTASLTSPIVSTPLRFINCVHSTRLSTFDGIMKCIFRFLFLKVSLHHNDCKRDIFWTEEWNK